MLIKEKNIYDIVNYLSNKFELVNMGLDCQRYKKPLLFFSKNILDSYRNKFYSYSINDLIIMAFEVKFSENSAIYYKMTYLNKEDSELNPIYVLLESRTRTIESNSHVLQKELILELGVNAFEFKHNLYDLYARFIAEKK